MIKEQREAIENLSEINNLSKEELQNENITAILDYEDLKSLDTVLSLIKEQQEEISKYKTLYERALSDVVKADKTIDLMAEQLGGLTIWNSKKEEPLILTDKEDVKQYFEQKVKSSKQ